MPGDVVEVAPGDRVMADLRVLEGQALRAAESALTGESVDKTADAVADDAPLADRSSVLHAGTRQGDDGRIVSSGGRVLAVTALGTDLSDARESAYEALGRIQLAGAQYRTDIAQAAAART